jgi:hypothetical protein
MSWPKLSVELAGPKAPDRCQSCGKTGWSETLPGQPPTLERWREHDANDAPTNVVVVLCRGCSDRLIEKHPRLYARLEWNQPYPGTMGLCLDCRHRDGVTCPLTQFNGGGGVNIVVAKPFNAHVCRSPRRLSGWIQMWRSPATNCDRRETATPAPREEATDHAY